MSSCSDDRLAPPRMVFWETTGACNLGCAHCRRDPGGGSAADDLTTGEAERLIDDVAACGTAVLVLSGGEPLLRTDIFRLARHGVAAGLTVALATNGTLLDAAAAAAIREAGIGRVSVSLDAADAAAHDRFRGQEGAFAAAVAGVEHLRAAGVPLQVNVSVTRENVDRLDEVYALAADLGACALHLFMLVPVGCGLQIAADQQVEAEEYERTLRWVLERQAQEQMEIRATCAPHIVRVAHESGAAVAGRAGGGCLAATGIAFVAHDGRVQACGYLPLVAGDVRTRPLPLIWRDSPLFRRLRDRDALLGTCGRCGYRTRCGGCRARAYGVYGDVMAEEPVCAYQPPAASASLAASP